jgi:hypothetical protein
LNSNYYWLLKFDALCLNYSLDFESIKHELYFQNLCLIFIITTRNSCPELPTKE